MVEVVIRKTEAIRRMRDSLLGERVSDAFRDLIGGRIGTALEENGRLFMYGALALPAFADRGLVTAATVSRDSAAVAVLEMGESRHFDLTGGLLNHPRGIAGVETGYFDINGQSLDLAMIEKGDLELARKLAVIKPYVGSEGGNWKFALHSQVSGMIADHLKRDIRSEWIFS